MKPVLVTLSLALLAQAATWVVVLRLVFTMAPESRPPWVDATIIGLVLSQVLFGVMGCLAAFLGRTIAEADQSAWPPAASGHRMSASRR